MENIEKVISSAKSSFQIKDYKNAIDGFKLAHQYYSEKEEVMLAAEMANNLSVALLQSGQKEQALSCVEGTDLIFQAHHDYVKQAMALGNYGAALESLKRWDEAESAYQKSSELLENSNEIELRSHVLKSLATLQIRRGKQLDSIISMQQSLTGKEKLSLRDRFLRLLLKLPFKFLGR